MTNIGYATLSVIPSAKGFGSKLSGEVDPQMSRAGTSGGKKFGAAMSSSAKHQGTGVGKLMGAGLLVGLGAAVVGIGAVLKTGFGEASDASAGTAQLAAGIKSTGNAAGVTVKGLNAYATSIEGMSGQTDDSIVASQKLLLTFTNIKNSKTDKIFDQATLASANMAAKMGGDAAGSAIQLGKALNDPVKGVSALGRVGVSFTKSQKDSIAAMVKTGDTAGAQKIILAELNKEFGGAAKAAGNSLPGKLEKAKRAFEGVSQSVAEGLLPVILPGLTKVGNKITKDVVPAVNKFVAGFKDGTGAGGTFRDILTKVGDVASTTGKAIGKVVGFIDDHGTAAKAAAISVAVLVVAVQAHALAMALSSGALQKWILQTTIVKTATATWAAVQWVLNAAMTANPIGLIVIAIAALVIGLVIAYKKSETFKKIVLGAMHAVGAVGKWLWNNVYQPVFSFLVAGLGKVMIMFGKFLVSISKVPGFGWAKKAGEAMQDAGAKALVLADNIKKIKDKTVTITLKTKSVGNTNHDAINAGRNAGGTSNWRGGMTWVGEEGPELINLPKGSQVFTHTQSMAMSKAKADGATAGSSGGGTVGRLTITNWEEGTGYFETVADGRVQDHAALQATTGRQY